mgnify:CR=1 FL=1
MLEHKQPEILKTISQTGSLEADTAKKLKDAAERFISSFNQKVKA